MEGSVMNLTEKAAYLKGLAEGLGLDPENKETKVINAIIDLLDDLALTVADNEDEIALITEQLDAVDEDLDALESYVYDDEECDCDICDDFDEDDLYELECPSCKEIVCFDSSIFDGDEQLTCPNCGEVFDKFEIVNEDDEEKNEE
jgi:hypothetical protein